jgi:hypothetical protein
MLVQDVFARAQVLFGDDASIQLTGDKVLAWVNDAQEEASNSIPNLLPQTGYLDSVNGQLRYDPPEDLYKLWGLKYKDSTLQSYYQLTYMSILDLYQQVDGWDGTVYATGTPQVFSRESNKLILFPAPREDTVHGIQIIYARYPVPVTNQTDAIDLPAYLNQFVLDFIMNKAYEMDEDWTAADRLANRVQQRLNEAQSTPEDRLHSGTYKSVTEMSEDAL